MSLDVYLTTPNKCPNCDHQLGQPRETFSWNITHNLGQMAGAAGIYHHLWRPEELGVTKAKELIDPLEKGLALLKSEPDRFKKLNPENGWGSYDGLVAFVESYLTACRKDPEAAVGVSR